MAQGTPFGGLQLSDGDEAAKEWMEESRRRFETDAEFHYRVKACREAMHAAFVNAPGTWHIALVLMLDEKIRRLNGMG